MKVRLTLFLLLLIALVVGLVFMLSNSKNDGPEPVASVKDSKEMPSKISGAVETPDDWDEIDEAEILQYLDAIDPDTFDFTIAPGESYITDGQEITPGVFLFTDLKAEVAEAGMIIVKSQMNTVDLNGRTDSIASPMVMMKSGMPAKIEIGRLDQSVVELKFTATLNSDDTIRLEGSGKYDSAGE